MDPKIQYGRQKSKMAAKKIGILGVARAQDFGANFSLGNFIFGVVLAYLHQNCSIEPFFWKRKNLPIKNENSWLYAKLTQNLGFLPTLTPWGPLKKWKLRKRALYSNFVFYFGPVFRKWSLYLHFWRRNPAREQLWHFRFSAFSLCDRKVRHFYQPNYISIYLKLCQSCLYVLFSIALVNLNNLFFKTHLHLIRNTTKVCKIVK